MARTHWVNDEGRGKGVATDVQNEPKAS
jgi:hypothetical protein